MVVKNSFSWWDAAAKLFAKGHAQRGWKLTQLLSSCALLSPPRTSSIFLLGIGGTEGEKLQPYRDEGSAEVTTTQKVF